MTYPTFWNFIISIWIKIEISSEEIRINRQIQTVIIGDSVTFRCSKDETEYPVNWRHRHVGSSLEKGELIYNAFGFIPEYQKDFSEQSNETIGTYELTIKNIKQEHSGTYYCEDNDKFGTTVSSEVIVIEYFPECSSNMSIEGSLGENSCHLEPDYIEFTCNTSYYGNRAPVLRWKTMTNDDVISGVTDMTSFNWVMSSLVTKSSLSQNGSYFICTVDDVDIQQLERFKCQSEDIKMMYAFNSSNSRNRDEVDRSINCSANTSLSQCSYTWINVIGSNEAVIRSRTISLDDPIVVASKGNFQCLAECKIHKNICRLKAFELHYSQTSENKVPDENKHTTTIIVVVVFVAIIIAIIIISLLCYFRKRRKAVKQKQKKTKEFSISRESLDQLGDLLRQSHSPNEKRPQRTKSARF